jgi:hypothetical protein
MPSLEPHPRLDGRTSNTSHPRTRMTQLQFHSYRLHTHEDEFPLIHYGGCLFQQHLCNMWVSINQNRSRWIENNQSKLRASLYSGLEDTVHNADGDVDLHNLRRRVVPPTTPFKRPLHHTHVILCICFSACNVAPSLRHI